MRFYKDHYDVVIIGGALAGNFISWGIASVNAMAVACLCYCAYTFLIKKRGAVSAAPNAA